MSKKLRIPAVLAAVVVGGASAVGLVSSTSCHDDNSCSASQMLCVPVSSAQDGGPTCYQPPDAGNCASGCEAICEPLG